MYVYGQRRVFYDIGQGKTLDILYWVTDVSYPIVATRDLCNSGLNSLFTQKGAFLFDALGHCVNLVEKEGSRLWFVKTFGRVTDKQASFTEMNAVSSTTATAPAQGTDRWEKHGNCLTLCHSTPRRRLLVPTTSALTSVLEDCKKLRGARKTVVVTVGSTTAKEINDSFKTARPADAALPDFWTGKTVFQIQKVSAEVNAMRRVTGKQTVPSIPAPPGLEISAGLRLWPRDQHLPPT
jgi:hypothetical protein